MENKTVRSSRNRNKNKNRNLQMKANERKTNKKVKDITVEEKVVVQSLKDLEDEKIEVKALVVDTPLRDNVVVVPDRKVIVEDEDDDPDFISINIDDVKFSESEDFVDRFKFDEEDDDSKEEVLEEFLAYENVEEVPYEEIHQLDRDEADVETVSVEEDIIPRATDEVDINARKYFSFESRIMLLLIVIIISFFIAGIFIFKAITSSTLNSTIYDEKSEVEYSVCINDPNNQYYTEKCLDSDMEYLSGIAERIPVEFDYEMEFDEAVSTSVSYYVSSKVNIYREKAGKILNTMEEVLVERTDYEVFGEDASFSVDVELPFKKYREYVSNYNNQYGLDGYAEVEVIFYVDNGNVIKKAATMSIPLTKQTFTVDVLEVNNAKQRLVIDEAGWAGINTSYSAVGVVFVLFGVLGIIRLSNLVFKVMGTTSMYQRKLNKILREYDKYIVLSRGDYEVDGSKRLIKVTSFGELLDARNTLEKPIVYVKVNNVKSEFYVEDSESIYKYTLKEADVEGK